MEQDGKVQGHELKGVTATGKVNQLYLSKYRYV